MAERHEAVRHGVAQHGVAQHGVRLEGLAGLAPDALARGARHVAPQAEEQHVAQPGEPVAQAQDAVGLEVPRVALS